MSLNTALNIAGGSLTFTTGGDANWFEQFVITHDGVAAGQSGNIDDSEESYVQTVISGPGVIQFWWKVSSEEDYDFLEFRVDGALQELISGEVGWEFKDFPVVGAGPHTLWWSYYKDISVSEGDDAGYLDDVEWITESITEERLVEIESEVTGEIDKEDGLVEIESELSSWEDTEYGVVEMEAEVSSWEGNEYDYGLVEIVSEVKGSTVQYETRQVNIESEIESYDKQNYREYREVDCQAIVRAKVPAPTVPNLTGRVPSPGETLVRRNQPVSFILFSGNDDDVDIDTVQVTVNGHLYLKGDPEFSYTGNFSRYNIEVAHPVWGYEEVVSVVINASSRLGVAMDEVGYSFTVEWIDALTRTGLGKIEFYETGQYVLDILTIQEDWVRQGAIRETSDLELWYGRYMKLPKVEDVEIAVLAGDKESLGKEVLENGYFSIKVGDSAYTKMYSDTIVHLGSMFANTKKTLRFKLDVPLGAVTKKYTMLELQIIPKMLRSWARFPWGIGIYNSDVNLFDFHPNQVVYRAYVFDNIMWQTLEEAGIVTSPFYRGEDKQW